MDFSGYFVITHISLVLKFKIYHRQLFLCVVFVKHFEPALVVGKGATEIVIIIIIYSYY